MYSILLSTPSTGEALLTTFVPMILLFGFMYFIMIRPQQKAEKKKALETNAISEMYKNAKLTGNQQIINITTTQSVESWVGIYTKRKVIAHGYVIEFEE